MTTPVSRVMLASQAAASNRTKIDYFPANIGTHGMMMVFNEYKFTTPGSRSLKRLPGNVGGVVSESNGGILLPIPNTLIDSNNMRIGTSNMYDAVGSETAASAAAGAKSAFQSGGFQGVADAAGAAISGAFGNVGNAGSADALFLARRLFSDSYQLGAVSQGLGAAINPKASLLFQGIDLKEFSFEWTLAPTEQAESDLLRSVIRRLKVNALPSYTTETAFTRSMLNYPSTVDIYLLGVDTGYFFLFKTAMIRTVSVNYTPNGLSVLRGGKPSAVNLSITLQEMDIHTADDYGVVGSQLSDTLDGFASSGSSSRSDVNSTGSTVSQTNNSE